MIVPKEAYPLCWPDGWKRTTYRRRSQFGERSIASARDEMYAELGRLGGRQIVLSTNLRLRMDGLPFGNQAQPSDTGVAVYFYFNQKPHVLACDKWDNVQSNIWAIVKHIEAMRGQSRWGVGNLQQAFSGYAALPERTNGSRPWYEVLGVTINATEDQIKEAYRGKVAVCHPDRGGNHEEMVAVNRAYEEALNQK